LGRAEQLGGKRLHIHSDSELLVKQMNGEYRVKNPDLLELYREAKELCRSFDTVSIRHVRREQNRRADELCNEALDGEKTKSSTAPPAAKSKKASRATDRSPAIHEEAVQCLQVAASSWARGN